MASKDRRGFLKALLAGGGMAGLYPSLARALDIPADDRTGTIMDVEHVVILTQENRAFDHYFGALNGVQGFGDRFVAPAPDLGPRVKRTVFVQPNEFDAEPRLIAPFRLNTQADFAMARHDGTPHGFPDGQAAWDNGRMGQWTQTKHNHSMGYFTREDIPFQYALAEAFTLCDAYHCAMHLCTNPNRLYIWTGTHDPLGKNHGPALDNAYDNFGDEYGHGGYTWTTYPERLLAAGISFQIYQLMEDNFGDNPLVGFRQYRKALETKTGVAADLVRRTLTTRGLDKLKADVEAGTLPQVSWIVAPEALSEHPNPSSPQQGAEYTAQVLDALTANPAVWAKTVFLINFDENDGLFDHVPPPAPPARDPLDPTRYIGGTTVPVDDEYHTRSQDKADAVFLHRPYGLGPRVPLYAISPWSKGGYVSSEVFDHTSVVRFLEVRFGVMEPNISQWRRTVCGDLTSCFNFKTPNAQPFLSTLPATRVLSDRAAALPQARPYPPEILTAPQQEEGGRRRRATPYDVEASVEVVPEGGAQINLINRSKHAGVVFHLYDINDLHAVPRRYTVSAGKSLTAELPVHDQGIFDLFLLGPSSFHRRFTGVNRPTFSARLAQSADGIKMQVRNLTDQLMRVEVRDVAYGQPARFVTLKPNVESVLALDLNGSHHWYDILLRQDEHWLRMAGHVETGEESWSDPAAHGPAHLNHT